ncbi:MAG: 3-dehydroquinate synthase [Bacteroidaceae bacterium]|nr:3-dehydroquinate synthase [Bacteroidaceae bacterium]
MQEIIYTHNTAQALETLIADLAPNKVFVLTDEHTHELCKPRLDESPILRSATSIVIGSSDANKTLESLAHVWQSLGDAGATRHSLLICLGGGMITDLGGFAAATFKRGMRFINVPTTLLAMVDAAVGGKTGINFNGLKNEIGAFREAEAVVIDTHFLHTLDTQNLRSGYAEMLKHALLKDNTMLAQHLMMDFENPDFNALQHLVEQSVEVKKNIVSQDPTEKGLRKALNLAHTTAHALESLAMSEDRTLLHGYAVAWGIVGELYLSCRKLGFPTERMRQTACFIRETYGHFHFTCQQYEQLYAYMTHDKKKVDANINFTLLADVGDIRLDQHATKEELFEMFDFMREGA